RSTSGAASATRTGTTTCLRPERDTPSRCWDRHRVLATFVSMATRARNGSARSRGGLDEAAPDPVNRPAAAKSPARQAPRRKQGQGSQTRSAPKSPKKKSNRKPSGKPGTGKGRTAQGRSAGRRPAPARPPRDPVVIL